MGNWKAVSIEQVGAACQRNVSFQLNRNNSEVSKSWDESLLPCTLCSVSVKAQKEQSFQAATEHHVRLCRKRIAAEMGLLQIYLRPRTDTRWGSAGIIVLVPSFVLSPQICLACILLQHASINLQRIHLGSTSRMEMLWPLDVDRWGAYSHVLYYWQ